MMISKKKSSRSGSNGAALALSCEMLFQLQYPSTDCQPWIGGRMLRPVPAARLVFSSNPSHAVAIGTPSLTIIRYDESRVHASAAAQYRTKKSRFILLCTSHLATQKRRHRP